MTTEEELDSLMASIRARCQGISHHPSITEGTTAEIAMRLAEIRSILGNLRSVEDELIEELSARMEDDQVAITGVGMVSRKPRTSSTWIDEDSRERMMEDSIRAMIQRTCVDPATGEIHPPLARVASEIWRLTTESFSFVADPKSAFRKVLGLAPDEYRSKRVTGYNISIEEETL